jgi:hypothetical protein
MQLGKQMLTYQVIAMGLKGFSLTEVLLDNQVDISIVRPDLLRAFWPVNEPVKGFF